ncbi:MAG: hypothetical protein QGG40_06755 [Myxococcota bacterium]|nr:hypothetical protein [Myxococcota bacterium]
MKLLGALGTIASLSVLGALALPGTAHAACTVYITKYESSADHKVYFTEYDGSQKAHQLIEGCKLTQYESSATFKVYITSYESSASIVIKRENFPKP